MTQRKIKHIEEWLDDTSWWRSDTRDTISDAAYELDELGWNIEDITNFLDGIIYSMRGEYGD